MAAPHEIAAYRDAGHSVAETCEYFGIKDRAVYKACQLARTNHALRAPAERQPGSRPPRPHQPVQRPVVAPASPSPAWGEDNAASPTEHPLEREQHVLGTSEPWQSSSRFRDVASDDDIAGDTTYWKCPVTGELMPIIPGVGRKSWNAERIALHERLARMHEPIPAAPALALVAGAPDRAAVPTPVPQDSASQSERAAVPASEFAPDAPALSTAAPPVFRPSEPVVIVKRYPVPERVQPVSTTWLFLGEYLPPPNIILALAVVLMLILVCSW